jgi:hypothetical protein
MAHPEPWRGRELDLVRDAGRVAPLPIFGQCLGQGELAVDECAAARVELLEVPTQLCDPHMQRRQPTARRLLRPQLVEQPLTGDDLVRADQQQRQQCRAVLTGADLSNAKLFATKLRNAELNNANLDYALLAYSDMSDASDADLSDAILTNANLIAAQLPGANLEGANLTGARLSEAELEEAKGMTQSQLESAVGDSKTKIPHDLTWPATWPQPHSE